MKERLNTLLHKKIVEQEKDGKDLKTQVELPIKSEVDASCDINNKHIESPEIQENHIECALKEQVTKTFLLHEVLSEKKKALLKDKEVIAFFQNKIK